MIEAWRKVMCFFAHTDDEMICAGTLHRLARSGCEVHVVTFAQAATERDRKGMDRDYTLCDEWSNSLDIIGVPQDNRYLYDIRPSCNFQPHRQSICQWIYDCVEKHKPDCVFTLSPDDENTAHSIVGVECERVMRGRVPTLVRCQFPWNYSIGRPNLYVTLSEQDVTAKQNVIEAYKSQHFRYNYGAMLLGYARVDGLSVKVPYAEKFEIVRSVV